MQPNITYKLWILQQTPVKDLLLSFAGAWLRSPTDGNIWSPDFDRQQKHDISRKTESICFSQTKTDTRTLSNLKLGFSMSLNSEKSPVTSTSDVFTRRRSYRSMKYLLLWNGRILHWFREWVRPKLYVTCCRWNVSLNDIGKIDTATRTISYHLPFQRNRYIRVATAILWFRPEVDIAQRRWKLLVSLNPVTLKT